MALRFRHLLVTSAVAIALGFTGIAHAQFDLPGGQAPGGQQLSADRLAQVQFLADRDAVGPGETFDLVILFNIQPNWHIYWRNPGEGAASPNIRITGPEGFEIGEIQYPRPKIVESPIGDMYCHEGSTALFVPVTAPENLSEGTAAFTAEIGFAVCDSRQCFFGRRTLSAVPAVKTHSEPQAANANVKSFQAIRDTLPVRIDNNDESAEATARITGDGDQRTLTISGPAHGFTEARFLPYESPGVKYGEPAITFDDDRFNAVIQLEINDGNFTNGPPTVGGLVGLGTNIDDPSYEAALPLEGRDRPQT